MISPFMPVAKAAAGILSASGHEGQLNPSGSYSSGNITTYKEGDTIKFRFTISASAAATGQMKVEFTSQDTGCMFFDGSFALLSQTNSYGYPITVSKSGVATNNGSDWAQVIDVSAAGSGSTTVNYQLKLSASAGECSSGSPQHSRLANVMGDTSFKNIGNQNVPIPANQIIELPEITVEKWVDTDGNGTVDRHATAGEWSFKLDGGTPQPTNSDGKVVFTNVTPNGNHTITEVNGPAGQEFLSGSGTACNFYAGVATATVESGTTAKDALCVFNNTVSKGRLTLVKNVTNDNGGTALPSAWTLTASGPTTISGKTNTPSVTNASVSTGTYALSESGGPSGYAASSWSCVGGSQSGSSVTIAANQNVTCTITNDDQPGTLEIKKIVVNDNGGSKAAQDFSYIVNGGSPTAFNANGTSTQTVNAGNYTVTEAATSEYAASYTNSLNATTNCRNLFVANGATVTCTITNDDIAPTLTLVKRVINDNGGSAKNTDWLLSAVNNEDMSVVNGVTGSTGVTKVAVKAGNYTLSESNGPTGYTSKGWVCEGAVLSGATLALGLGQNAVCTVTNDDDSPYLKLIKIVVNDDGGKASENDWLLSATGVDSANATSFSGQSGVNSSSISGFQIGDYTLSESGGPAGYVAGSWSCEGADVQNGVISLILGQSATCTITNNDKPGTITVIKNVDDGFGHVTKDVQNWTWNYDGVKKHKNNIATGSNNPQQVSAGTYIVSENQKQGYHVVTSSCGGSYDNPYDKSGQNYGDYYTHPSTSQKVTVGLGKNVTCTFTNARDTGRITVHKKIGDKVDPKGWTWWLGDYEGTNKMGTSEKVPTGWYSFGENQQQGYSFASLKCKVDGRYVWVNQDVTSKIYVGRDDHVECTFVNTRDTGTVTVVKDAQPDSTQGFNFTIQPMTDNSDEGDSRDRVLEGYQPQEDVQDGIVGQRHSHEDQDGPATGPTSFTLVDNGMSDGKNTKSTTLPTGKYMISEAATVGWDLSAVSCGDSAVSIEDGVAYVEVTKGVTITCTFTNTQRAALTIVKDAQPNASKSFAFTSTIPDESGVNTSFSLSDDGTNLTNSKKFDNLKPGTYTITESAVDAWKLDAISCSGSGVTMTRNGYTLTVTLAAGAVATCTFVNSFVPQVLGDATVTPTLVNTGADTIIGATIAFILTAAAVGVVLQRRKAYVTVERN